MKKLELEARFELATAVGCIAVLVAGTLGQNLLATLMSVICLGVVVQRWTKRYGGLWPQTGATTSAVASSRPKSSTGQPAPARRQTAASRSPSASRRSKNRTKKPGDSANPAEFVDGMIADGRYALLLRPEVAANLTAEQRKHALDALHEDMTFVPEGEVKLCATNADTESGGPQHATAVFIDRYPITNELYKQFVDDGGYENEEFWDDGVFTGVANFVDQTGRSGPRYWNHGTYGAGLADHPVVGISWFEANACARWMGKRLPASPEWVKAAAWPVTGPDGQVQQRKYPWGDRFGEGMANTWSSSIGGTVPVVEFGNGASMSGAYQFVGNVWEWMAEDMRLQHQDVDAARAHCLKAIRGGAFDTYFESQATCHFESGDDPFARKHNIGFRCVVTADELLETEREIPHAEQKPQSSNTAVSAS